MVKIDTQGHEIEVFKGFQESLRRGLMRYVLFEYWVDAMDEAEGAEFGACRSVDILNTLSSYGYDTFDMGVLNHPKAPQSRKGHWREKYVEPSERAARTINEERTTEAKRSKS